MAMKSNHRTVVFLSDYATKSAGDEFTCDGMLARSLVSRGIAEYKKEASIESDSAPFNVNIPDLPELQDKDLNMDEAIDLGEVHTIQTSEPEFQPLPEATEENNSEEKVSEPIATEEEEKSDETSKQKSSSKPKNKK